MKQARSLCSPIALLDEPCAPAPTGANRFCEWPGYAARRSVSRNDWYARRRGLAQCAPNKEVNGESP